MYIQLIDHWIMINAMYVKPILMQIQFYQSSCNVTTNRGPYSSVVTSLTTKLGDTGSNLLRSISFFKITGTTCWLSPNSMKPKLRISGRLPPTTTLHINIVYVISSHLSIGNKKDLTYMTFDHYPVVISLQKSSSENRLLFTTINSSQTIQRILIVVHVMNKSIWECVNKKVYFNRFKQYECTFNPNKIDDIEKLYFTLNRVRTKTLGPHQYG